MKLYHEFFGEKEYKNRKSEVWLLDEPRPDAGKYEMHSGDWFVKFYEDDAHKGDRLIVDHTESYAEDCAENWVIGVEVQIASSIKE